MNNTDKLLRAFIEAQGYDIEEDAKTNVFVQKGKDGGFLSAGTPDVSFTETNTYYKVTKKIEHYKHHGDYFSLGCAVLSEDLQKTLHKEGVDCGDNDIRNVCKAIIDTVVFHIK